MSHHAPDYPNLAWGGQGKLAPYLDVWDVHEAIRTGGKAGQTTSPIRSASSRRRKTVSSTLLPSADPVRRPEPSCGHARV